MTEKAENVRRIKKTLIVIGGGPAGLAAALSARRSGVADILIIERDKELGGILNQCIHAGFGLHMFKEELTGPEYATRFIRMAEDEGIEYRLNSMVLAVSGDRVVTFVSPEDGYTEAEAEAVILAMGCRERTRGALNIAGSRPSGILTAGAAQRFVNIEGYMPGREAVILGSGDIGLIMARRLTLEGAKVKAVCELMPYSNGLPRNITQCLDDFGIPLRLSHTVTGIKGRERLEGVTVSKVDGNRKPIAGSEEEIECDLLLLSVGLIPENELSVGAGIELDPVTGGAKVTESLMTDTAGIFACGNALHVHDLVDFVTGEGYKAGEMAAEYIKGEKRAGENTPACITRSGAGVRYIVPQSISWEKLREGDKIFFRVDNIYRKREIEVSIDGRVYKRIKRAKMTPSEMESFTADGRLAEALKGASELSLAVF